MSEVRHRGRRRTSGGEGIWGGHVTYDYVSPGITLPNEDPDKWMELSSEVTVSVLTKEELEAYRNRKK